MARGDGVDGVSLSKKRKFSGATRSRHCGVLRGKHELENIQTDHVIKFGVVPDFGEFHKRNRAADGASAGRTGANGPSDRAA